MRKIIFILLFVVLLVYTSGSYLVFKYREFEVKQEMKAFIKSNPQSNIATKLSFSKSSIANSSNGFEWEEEGKEFSYLGEMYDVVSTTGSKDSLHIIALKDGLENKLIDDYSSLVKDQTNKKSPVKSLLKLFSSCYLQAGSTQLKPIITDKLVHHSFHSQKELCLFLDLVILPPKA